MQQQNAHSSQSVDETPDSQLPLHQYVQFDNIIFRANFDSGNLGQVKQINSNHFRIIPSADCVGTAFQKNTRSWFFFAVKGFQPNTKQILCKTFFKEKVKITDQCLEERKVNGRDFLLQFDFTATNKMRLNQLSNFFFKTSKYFLLFRTHFFQKIHHQTLLNNRIYSNLQILCHSPEGRKVLLFSISSNEGRLFQREKRIDKLFPEGLERPFKYRSNKPVIVITARVHPGQTPSSYCLQGIVNFLLSKDLRAILLLKYFQFLIIPMLNPDGVFHGHFRMDVFHQNLNRHYKNPDFKQQPSVFAVKSIVHQIQQDKRLAFYFDLHAHPGKRGCFIYGNAHDQFVDQVQTQVFCKLVGMNSHFFEYESCNFSMKHMNHKDKSDQLSKEGCGRVVIYKTTKIIHSYTLQCGYHSTLNIPQLPQTSNTQFSVGSYKYIRNQFQQNNNPIFADEPPLFTQDSYRSVGQSLMIAVLDTFDKNPYSRVSGSQYKSMQNLRRLTAFQVFHEAQRFRMFQQHIYARVKKINELIDDIYDKKFYDKKVFDFKADAQFCKVDWPAHMGYKMAHIRSPKAQSKCNRVLDIEEDLDFQKLKETKPIFFKKNKQVQQSQESGNSDVQDQFDHTVKKKIQFGFKIDSSVEDNVIRNHKKSCLIVDTSLHRGRIYNSFQRRVQDNQLPLLCSRISQRQRQKDHSFDHQISQLLSPTEKKSVIRRSHGQPHQSNEDRQALKVKLFTNLKLPNLNSRGRAQQLKFERNRMRLMRKG